VEWIRTCSLLALACRTSIHQEHGKTMLASMKPTELPEMFRTPQLRSVAWEVDYTIVKSMQEGASV